MMKAMLIWLVLVSAASAQVVVSKGFGSKRLVAVNGFTGSAPLTEIVKNDVRLSGYLGLATAAGGEFVQQGAVRTDGSVECTVTQSATKKVVLSKVYPGNADARRLGHTISDDIVQAITGQRGIAQTKIAFILKRGRGRELAVMDYDGANVRQLTNDGRITAHPRWSPDGGKLVCTSYLSGYPDVVEVNLGTRQRRVLANFPGLNTGATFAPDGTRVALTLSKDGNPELYTMDVNGISLHRLTRTKGGESSPEWSPDGRQLAFVSDEGGTPQVYVVNADGGEPVRLTRSPSYNTEPAWSRPPAGSDTPPLIAVTSRVGGKFQVGIVETGTGGVKALAADGDDNTEPSWAPHGRLLVFAKTRGWKSRLCLLDVMTGEQLALPAVDGEASEPAWGP
jgi:TolB protein